MKRNIITCLFMIQSIILYGQVTKKTNALRRTIYIDVCYDDQARPDTLSLHYSPDFWGSVAGRPTMVLKPPQKINSFKFDLDPDEKGAYILLKKENVPKGTVKIPVLPYLIAEPGDSIQIHFSKNSFSFTGRGYIKYKCQYEIDQVKKTIYSKGLMKPFQLKYNTDGWDVVIDSLYLTNMIPQQKHWLAFNKIRRTESLLLLEQYKNKLTHWFYQLMNTEILGLNSLSGYGELENSYNILGHDTDKQRMNRNQTELISTFSNRELPSFKNIPDSILALSSNYISFMVKSLGDTLVRKQEGYKYIKVNYKGLLRDRLITAYFMSNYSRTPNASEQVADALTFVKPDYCRKILSSFNTALKPGNDAFKFSLPDSTGKMISMNDFKGKVVVMDFWFTGCPGCRALSQKMKPVINYFKGNEKVAFVSVSIDKTVEKWKDGLNGGLYTHPGNVDLYTEGLNYNAPIIKHYGIVAYPTLILIDQDGKIITGTPVYPNDSKGRKDFIALIESNVKR